MCRDSSRSSAHPAQCPAGDSRIRGYALLDIRQAERKPVSVTGCWIVGAVPADVLKSLRADINTAQFEPLDGTVDLEWWSAMDHAAIEEPGPGHLPSEAALLFGENIDRILDDEAVDRCIDTFNEAIDDGIYVETARKGSPFAALCYGLTFDAARRLPGRGGCFLLDPGEVSAVLASIGPILEQPPGGRAAFTERANAWCDVMTDAAGSIDTLNLLDGPLRVLRRADETGSGVISVTQWY